ncbi:MAG: hypothetical protein FWD25_05470 [Clostridia bacterium]|nr:hypothetical protein [Clostridia bacterium]
MQSIQNQKQRVKRWVAGSLCLLMLWRPLRADSDVPTVNEPLPEAHGESLPVQGIGQEAPAPVTAEPATPEPTSAPSETEAPVQKDITDPASFSSGYAMMLSGGEIRLHPHGRPSSPALLRLAAGEVVLVTGRVAYQATPQERRAQQTSGEVFDDWFALRVRDAEGQIVEGYVPSHLLRPMETEEIEDMDLDGIPQVNGALIPLPEKTPLPSEKESEEEGAPPPEETPSLEPEPEPEFEPEFGPEEDAEYPMPEVLQRANALLAASESFMQAAPFVPTIHDVQIIYGQNGSPPVPYAQLVISADTSGSEDVYVTGPAPSMERRYCTYDPILDRYVLIVYAAGDYMVYAEGTSMPVSVAPQLTLGNIQDTNPPTIGAFTLWPETEAVIVSMWVEDELGAGPNETASGVAEVWLEMEPFDGVRFPLLLNTETGHYVGEVFENGLYYLFAKDRAGNKTQLDPVHAFEIKDVTPPVIANVQIDPPDDGKALTPMVQISASVTDRLGDRGDNWASGVAMVEIGFFYGQNAQRIPQAVDLQPMYPGEGGNPALFTTFLMENGSYVIVATDFAGNQAFQRLEIDHIGEERPRKRDPNWEFRPVDDDGDGLFTQTEYRLGLDPFNRDTAGDGLGDGLSVRLGLDARNFNPAPAPSVFSRAQDVSMLNTLVASGWLSAPVGEDHPGAYRLRVAQEWRRHRNHVAWMHPQGNTLLGINNRTLFAAVIPRTESLEIQRALSLARLGYGPLNNEIRRAIEPCADGSLALLFDRGAEGGPLIQDAFLIDTQRMQAYRIPNTRGARGLAISNDGAFIAVWRTDSLERVDLRTGQVLRIDDPERCGRVEMLRFLPGNRLVTRINSIGYSALLADGGFEVGNAAALPCLIQFQDLTGLTIYDRNKIPFRINLELLLRYTGIYVQGETAKEDAIRVLSPRNVYERELRVGQP